MSKISKRSLKEIKASAREYIAAVKGKSLKKEDILYAETLMKLGYITAKLKNKKKENRSCRKSNFSNYNLRRAV